jgi:endonuclease/exonuclease/phosphatase (EEP) superfamily protein YafD
VSPAAPQHVELGSFRFPAHVRAGCARSIVTFNVNNINKRLEDLLAWLAKTKPDVVCLQELNNLSRF